MDFIIVLNKFAALPLYYMFQKTIYSTTCQRLQAILCNSSLSKSNTKAPEPM